VFSAIGKKKKTEEPPIEIFVMTVRGEKEISRNQGKREKRDPLPKPMLTGVATCWEGGGVVAISTTNRRKGEGKRNR